MIYRNHLGDHIPPGQSLSIGEVLPRPLAVCDLSALFRTTCPALLGSSILVLLAKRCSRDEFTHEAAPQEDGRTNLKSTSPEGRGSAYLWDEAEAWRAWGKVTGNKKKVRSSSFHTDAPKRRLLHGSRAQKMVALAGFEGGVWDPLTSNVTERTLAMPS